MSSTGNLRAPGAGLSRVRAASLGRHDVLRDHADLLRQRRAPPGSRVHDDRRRRDGAASSSARRAGLLPHRHRRARRAGRRRCARARCRAAAASRPQRRALQVARPADRRQQRFLHTHHRPPARSRRAGGSHAREGQRFRVRGDLRGLVLPALRGLQGRGRDRPGQPLSYARSEDLTREFWPADYHLIGKDILRFHAIYWPALLMAAELELPRHIFVHGYLLMEGEKMSKSLGNVLDPFTVIERFGADALRFYVLREVPFGQDGSVSTASFELRYETELANELGNLASRTLAMIGRYRDWRLSPCAPDPALGADFENLPERVSKLIDGAELTVALDEIWQRVRRLNRYVEECAPWRLAGEPERAEELDRVLRSLAEGLRSVTVLLWPYMPVSAERLLAALGAPVRSLAAARLGAGAIERVKHVEPLFPKAA